MKAPFWLIWICLLFLFMACNSSGNENLECGPDVELGTLNLQFETRNFHPFVGNQPLKFTDSTGQSITLYLKEEYSSYSKLIVETTCNDFLFSQTNTLEYYNDEVLTRYFSSNDSSVVVSYEVYLGISGLNAPDPVFFDFFQLTSSVTVGEEAFGNGGLKIITSHREFEGIITNDMIANFESYRLISDTTLLGTAFSDVYVPYSSNPYTIYFQPGRGVIAFTIAENLFLLDQ